MVDAREGVRSRLAASEKVIRWGARNRDLVKPLDRHALPPAVKKSAPQQFSAVSARSPATSRRRAVLWSSTPSQYPPRTRKRSIANDQLARRRPGRGRRGFSPQRVWQRLAVGLR